MSARVSDLAGAMRALAEKGEFTHLSICATGGSFSASFTHASSQGVSRATDADPVKAAIDAINGAPVKGVKISKAKILDTTDDDLEFG